MNAAAARVLRVGVVGLGQAWQRVYRSALRAHWNHFHISIVCDSVRERAEREAAKLDCEVADGPAELISSGSLDAVLILDTGWQGLWPLELAAGAGKPCFVLPSLAREPMRADAIFEMVLRHGTLVMFAIPALHAAATVRLRRLARSRLGHPLVILSEVCVPDPAASPDSLSEAIGWCLSLMQDSPLHLSRSVGAEGGATALETIRLDFPGGRVAQIAVVAWPGAAADRLQASVFAERGRANVKLPAAIDWYYHGGVSRERLPAGQSAEFRMLRRFHQMVTGTRHHEPDLEHAHAVWKLVQAALGSVPNC